MWSSPLLQIAHLPERIRQHNPLNDAAQAVIVCGSIINDPGHGRHVEVFDRATECVAQQVFDKSADELLFALPQFCFELSGPTEWRFVPHSRSIDRLRSVMRSQLANGIEGFEGEPRRIDAAGTRVTVRIAAVFLKSLTHRKLFEKSAVVITQAFVT